MAGSRRRSIHLSLQVHRDPCSACAGVHVTPRHVVHVLLAVQAEHLLEAMNVSGASPSSNPSIALQKLPSVPPLPEQRLLDCDGYCGLGREGWEARVGARGRSGHSKRVATRCSAENSATSADTRATASNETSDNYHTQNETQPEAAPAPSRPDSE